MARAEKTPKKTGEKSPISKQYHDNAGKNLRAKNIAVMLMILGFMLILYLSVIARQTQLLSQ